MLRVTHLIGFGVGGRKVTREFTASATDTTDLTTYTFTSQNFGTETQDRFMVIAITGTGTVVGRTVSSCSVGGVAASVVLTAGSSTGVTELWGTPKVSDGGPTGSSGTVSVTFSGAMLDGSVSVYAVKGAPSTTPSDTATDTTDPLSTTIDAPANGIIIGVARATTTPGDTTWAGITEDADAAVGPVRHTSASDQFTTSEANRTVSASWGAGAATGLAAAAWAP